MRERWKVAREGDEIKPETIHLQEAGALIYQGDSIPIEEWANEFVCIASLSRESDEGVVKASVNARMETF